MVAAGAATRRRGLTAAGTALCAARHRALADIARSPVVPGANDNLSAVAVLVSVAETLRERPVSGLRVILASCGAEEVLQGGVYGFAARHLAGSTASGPGCSTSTPSARPSSRCSRARARW